MMMLKLQSAVVLLIVVVLLVLCADHYGEGGIFVFLGMLREAAPAGRVPGALLIPLGLVVPLALRPLFKGWMKVGHVMGWINTRIILGVLYFGLITPMGVAMRMFGWDSMSRALRQDAESYRVVRQARPRTHMTRQF